MENETLVLVEEGALPGATEAVGMPQLDFSTFPNQIFWLLVALGATYYILSRIALPRIGAVLAERQGTITNDIAAAEELKLKAMSAEKAYDKALADARSEASRIVAGHKAEMQQQIGAATAKADADIAERTASSEERIAEIREGMRDSVSEVARETARAVVEAMGGTADGDSLDAAVTSRMSGTDTAGEARS